MTDDPHPATLPAQPLATITYVNTWRWNNQATLPPINGQVRTDLGAWVNATHVYLSHTTDGGQNLATLLPQISVGSVLELRHGTDPTRYARYTIKSAIISQATYVDIPVTYVSAAGTIANSGTVLEVSAIVESVNGTTCTWRVYPARDPNRFWIEVDCQHGMVREQVATVLGWPTPNQQQYVETTMLNLRRRMGCNCNVAAPAF